MSPVLILEGTTNNLPSSRPLWHRLLSSSLSQAYLAIPAWHESRSIFLLFCELYGILISHCWTLGWHSCGKICHNSEILFLSGGQFKVCHSMCEVQIFFFNAYYLMFNYIEFHCCICPSLNSIMSFCSFSVRSLPVILNNTVSGVRCHLSKLCLLCRKWK